MIKHKLGTEYRVADALSHRHSLLSTMQTRVVGFDTFSDLYCDDPDFRDHWVKCVDGSFQQFMIHDKFLFKGHRLCIPQCSLRATIISEVHEGGLAGHFGKDKTMALLSLIFYWPRMEQDVA